MLEASRAHPDLVAQLVPAPMSLRVIRRCAVFWTRAI